VELKMRPAQIANMVFLALTLAVLSVYVPLLSLLNLLIVVPYVIVGASNNKVSVLTVAFTFAILLIFTDISYALNICIAFAVPGILIGKMMYSSINKEDSNKYSPIFWGTIVFMITLVIYTFIAQKFMSIDLMGDMTKTIKEAMQLYTTEPTLKDLHLFGDMTTDEIVKYFTNTISTMLFARGLVWAVIVYYLSAFVINKKFKAEIDFPKFAEFYLPGQTVIVACLIYILFMLLDYAGLGIKTDIILMNLEMVFYMLFFLQGVALYVHYVKAWIANKRSRTIFILIFVLLLFGFLGVAFIGVMDSIINLRKVRRIS
jgi:uncharacterized protein YybS (DUF2232 family)